MPTHLHPVVTTALLVWSAVAGAQQSPLVRVLREQQLVLSRVPAGSTLELRMEPGLTAVVRFDAEVEHVEVRREGHGYLVWWGEAGQSLLLEPRRERASVEPLPLEVVLLQGSIGTRLVFQLASAPSRPVRSEPEPERASPRREGGPLSRLVFSGVVGKSGVTGGVFQGKTVGRGVVAKNPRSYQAERGRAISFFVDNPVGGRPWVASEVVRLSRAGEVSEGGGRWTVSMEAPIAPGATGLVVVETAEDGAGAPVLLEVLEEGGSRSVRVEEAH